MPTNGPFPRELIGRWRHSGSDHRCHALSVARQLDAEFTSRGTLLGPTGPSFDGLTGAQKAAIGIQSPQLFPSAAARLA
jgi:hypothetical protein